MFFQNLHRSLDLPERDEHHHFDTQELPHRFDGLQLILQSSVEQHKAVHGKLGKQKKNRDLSTKIGTIS